MQIVSQQQPRKAHHFGGTSLLDVKKKTVHSEDIQAPKMQFSCAKFLKIQAIHRMFHRANMWVCRCLVDGYPSDFVNQQEHRTSIVVSSVLNTNNPILVKHTSPFFFWGGGGCNNIRDLHPRFSFLTGIEAPILPGL